MHLIHFLLFFFMLGSFLGKELPNLARRCPVYVSVKVVHSSLLEASIRFMQEYEWLRRRRENLGCYKGDGKPRTTN